MVSFIDLHRGASAVEPICKVPPIALSTYYAHKARTASPALRPERARRDASLAVEIQRVWQENRSVYGARKVWQQFRREGITVARCTVARLMREAGLAGVVRGGKSVRTIILADLASERPLDLVQHSFTAHRPNALWLADFSCVATWRGVVYVAFVIDVFSRLIVDWRASSTMRTDLVLVALEQAIHGRETDGRLIHHGDRGSQYLSIRCTERLADAGVEASVGSTGDAYDNALAESVVGLFKTEAVHHAGPFKGLDDVELATLE